MKISIIALLSLMVLAFAMPTLTGCAAPVANSNVAFVTSQAVQGPEFEEFTYKDVAPAPKAEAHAFAGDFSRNMLYTVDGEQARPLHSR